MKVLTFFNEKGGTGKTSFSIMFASYLAYELKQHVEVIDYDYPSLHFMHKRKEDLDILAEESNRQLVECAAGNTFYPVHQGTNKETYSQEDILEWIDTIKELKQSKKGYLILDFPGRFSTKDPFYQFVTRGLIDQIIVPIDSDIQSRQSALMIHQVITSNEFFRRNGLIVKPNVAFLWNKETASERRGTRDWYSDAEEIFRMLNIPIIGTRMRDVGIVRRSSSTFQFISSTICYPKENIMLRCCNDPRDRTKGSYIEDIFNEVKARVDGLYK